jgi:hypothetical protein
MARLELAVRKRDADQTLESDAAFAVVLCKTCEPILGQHYPLWGAHLNAALILHSAHRAVAALAEVPAMTDDDRRLGSFLAIERVPFNG